MHWRQLHVPKNVDISVYFLIKTVWRKVNRCHTRTVQWWLIKSMFCVCKKISFFIQCGKAHIGVVTSDPSSAVWFTLFVERQLESKWLCITQSWLNCLDEVVQSFNPYKQLIFTLRHLHENLRLISFYDVVDMFQMFFFLHFCQPHYSPSAFAWEYGTRLKEVT